MRLFLTAIFASAAFSAWASPQCTMEPESKWLSEDAMKAKVTAAGNAIEVFKKTKGGCYEVYGRDSKGKRVEIYYNPVSGDIVEAH
jgi:hypothetical protein